MGHPGAAFSLGAKALEKPVGGTTQLLVRPMMKGMLHPKWGSPVPIPRSRRVRLFLGIALIIGGTLWFLPILGWWMLPLGMLILSEDHPAVRRIRRKATLWLGRRRKPKHHPFPGERRDLVELGDGAGRTDR